MWSLTLTLTLNPQPNSRPHPHPHQNGVVVDASLPCNWGLTEEATRSSTCAGAKTLAAIEKQEVDRRNLQVSGVE